MNVTNTLIQKFNKKFKNNHIRELLKGSSIAFALKILGVGASYVFVFFVSRLYGTSGMGMYSLSIAVLLILQRFSTLGFKTSVLRFAGQFSAQKKHHKIKMLYKNMVELTVPVSVLLGVILYVFSHKLAVSVFNNESLTGAFKIISILIPFSGVNVINIELIRGLKDIRLSEYLRNCNRPLFCICFLLIINAVTANALAPVIAFSLAAFTTFLISITSVIKKTRTFSTGGGESVTKKEILETSLPMMVTALSFLLLGKIDTVMLGIFSTMENVGIYSIAFKLAAATSFVLYAVNTIVAPKISELYWSKRMDELKEVIRFSAKLIFMISAPILCVFLFFSEFFMGIFGEEFMIGRYALIFLTIGQFVNAISGSVGNILNMVGKQHIYRNIILVTTAMNIGLNYILIPKYGLNGAAIATMASVSFWNITSCVYAKSKMNITTYYMPGYFK